MKKTLKLTLFMFLICLSSLCFGCKNNEIGDLEVRDEAAKNELSQPLKDANCDYKNMVVYNCYYAGYSIPIPKGWEIADQKNAISLTDGKSVIYINHMPLNNPSEDNELQEFIDKFVPIVNNQKINSLTRKKTQSSSNLGTIDNSKDKITFYREFDNLKMMNSSAKYIDGLSEKRYYLKRFGMGSLVGVVCPTKQKTEMYKMLDCMVKNIKEINETHNNKVTLNIADKSYELPAICSKKIIDEDNGKIELYTVDYDSYLADSFVAVTNSDRKINDDLLDTLFFESFGVSKCGRYNYNIDADLKYADTIDSNDFFMTSATITKTAGLLKEGNMWNIETYKVKDKNIIIAYPTSKIKLNIID